MRLTRCIHYTALMLLLAGSAYADRIKYQGYCQQGNGTVTVLGYVSSQAAPTAPPVMSNFPSCTINVYSQGTTTNVSIFADNAGTTKGNPFVADTNGYYFFYVDDGVYDLNVSGSPVPTPFTLGAIAANDPYFQQPGIGTGPTGSTVRLKSVKLAEWKSVTDFGADPTGVADSAPAFRSAIAYACGLLGPSSNHGAHVWVPTGAYLWKSSVDNVVNCIVEGEDPVSTYLIANVGSTFSTYLDSGGTARTYQASIGGTGTAAIPGSQWRNLNFVSQGAVYTTMTTQSAEENSGVFNSYITGYTGIGADVVGFGTQNSSWQNLTFYAASTAIAGAHGMHFYECNSRCKISEVTVNHDTANAVTTQTGSAIKLELGTHAYVGQFHFEGLAIGLELSDSFATTSEVVENDDTPDNATVILIHGASGITAINTVKFFPGNQITICDQTQTGVSTCPSGGVSGVYEMNEVVEPFYSSEWNASGLAKSSRNVISTDSFVYTNFHFLSTAYFSFPNLMDVSNFSNGAMTFRQTNGNYGGFNFQSSMLTTSGFTGGGAYIGTSYQNDPSAGSFSGGCSLDSGTWTAHATTCSGVSNVAGSSVFYAFNGLTIGSTFTPTVFPFKITPAPNGSIAGIAITPTSVNPGCTNGVTEGRIWLNSNFTPYRFEICDAGTWYYPTLNTGP